MPSMRDNVYFSRKRLIIIAVVWLLCTILLATLVGVLKRCPESEVPVLPTTSPPSPSSTLTPTRNPDRPWEYSRLPENILPSHYIITLKPNFYTEKDLDFTGMVEIEISVTSPAKYIILHINKMNVTSHSLHSNDSGSLIPTDTEFLYPKYQFWVLPVTNGLKRGTYRLKMNFTGSLDGINGFYRSGYFDPTTNKTRYIVSSKFEPVDARKAFPCFDEPQMKAQYTVRLIHNTADGYFALSNMPIKSNVTLAPNIVMSVFERSVTMSTYLVCFVVCDFTYLEGRSNGNKLFRVFAPKHKKDQLQYSLDVGISVQNYFEEYFNLNYSLPKQDMIVIPNFAAGAMEHWGLITYRESAMLYNKNYHSLIDKFYVNRVISHELAHMWFGNVVTMQWWDDLWLNEGFASFVSYKGVQHSEPTWKADDLARLYSTRTALEVDDVISSHPIVVKVNTPAELSEVFDTITYRKGQAVILMLEGLMRKPNFQAGIQAYMQKFKFQNAKTSQLWDVLKTKTDLPVQQIMDTWTLQMGYPTITVSNSTPPVASQQWFLINPGNRGKAPKSPYNYLWRVQLKYKGSDSSSNYTEWINGTQAIKLQRNIDLTQADSWLLLNTEAEGFYRVNYPEALWKRFPRLIQEKKVVLTPSQKAMLVDDALFLARAGNLSYDAAMTVVEMIRTETSFPVWIRANAGLSFLSKVTNKQPELYGNLRIFIQRMTGDVYNTLLLNDTNDLQYSLLRRSVIGLACFSGGSKCRNDMKKMYTSWLRGTRIPLDLRDVALRVGLEEADTEVTWSNLWQRYQVSYDDVLKSEIINALAATNRPWLVNKLLNYAMDPKLIKEQDFFSVMSSVARKPTGRLVYWTWYRDNWEKLVKRFGLESRGLGRMVLYISPYLTTSTQLSEMEQFYNKYPKAGAGRMARQQARSQVESNIRWIQNNEIGLSKWLRQNNYQNPLNTLSSLSP